MKLLAPNGKPSNLTPEQYRLVRTPAFKEWFGDWENDPETASKVVDENGEPLVVNHTYETEKAPNIFQKSKEVYIDGKYKRIFENDDIYQKLKGIYGNTIIDGVKYDVASDYWEFWFTNKIFGGGYEDEIKYISCFLNIKNLYVRENGSGGQGSFGEMTSDYDGISGKKITNADGQDGMDYYIVLFSNQIKLADGSNTTFDGGNPDIRYKNGGLTMKKPKQLLAPNGKPSNLTPEQYRTVRTPAFKEWFGDWENDAENSSQVIDSNGEPLLVWHGSKSNENFNVFKQSSRFEFIYFAKTKEYAWFHFTKDIIDKPFQLRPFFLNIRNLLNAEEYGFEKVDFSELKSFFYGIHELSKDIQLNPKSQYKFWEVLRFSNDIYHSLKNQDYDGISFYENFYDNTTWNDTDDYSLSYVVMNPNQIKLADGSNTTFNSGNPDIRYADGGGVGNIIVTNEYEEFDSEVFNELEDEILYGFVVKDENKRIGLISVEDDVIELGIGYILGLEVFEKNKGYGKKIMKKIFEIHTTQHAFGGKATSTSKGFWLNLGAEFDESDEYSFILSKDKLRYADGGEVAKNKETYKKWKSLVNMSKGELEKFYNSQEGKDAGLSSQEASEQGISSGRESARWIMKMKDTNVSDWTPSMWRWAKKQISFISRMSGNKGSLYDDKGDKTRKHTSLLIWGHNPKKNKFDLGGLLAPQKMPTFIAPNGNRSNLLHIKEIGKDDRWVYLYDIVRTREFKEWFGDWEEAYKTKDYEGVSKIIDENGEPSICYHTTNDDFFEFNENFIGGKTDKGYYGRGFYFTEGSADSHYGQREIPCFLNIRNPYLKQSSYKTYELDTEDLKSKGYDGVIVFSGDIKNIDLSKGLGYDSNRVDEIVAYNPEDIKLADATNTAFDKYDSDIRYKEGGRTTAQTPAPKKDQIKGSDKNKEGSSKDLKSAKKIELSDKTIEAIKNKVNKHNEEYPKKKITIDSAKAVVRRGMGAYSSSYRPTISGGKPNSRVAWGLARLNAFIYKIIKGTSKSGKYSQDNDLIEELGYKVKNFEIGGVYQGTPHDFDKYSTEFIGTGEGNQVFGWGLYFTDQKDIADYYKNAGLKEEDFVKFNEKKLSEYNLHEDNKEQIYGIIDIIQKEDKVVPTTELIIDRLILEYDEENYPEFKELVELSKKTYNFIKDKKLTLSGNILLVNLFKGKNTSDYDLLEWEKPLNVEQLIKIFEEAEKIGGIDFKDGWEVDEKYGLTNNGGYKVTGEEMYRWLSKKLFGDKEASLFLLNAGIDGIKYKVGTLSGMEDKEGYNYVIFDANEATILGKEKYAEGGDVERNYSLRYWIPNVRGGWTKEKIRKALKSRGFGNSFGKYSINRLIAEFDSPQQFKEHIFYHGTGSYVGGSLSPSITMSERDAETRGGGGYGERYWSISLSKSKNTASNFTSQSRSGTVYAVILKKGAYVVDMPEIQDSNELEDIIEELWTKGVDAVKIGDWTKSSSEQELSVINPNAIFKYDFSESFMVYGKERFENLTDDEIAEIYYKAKENVMLIDTAKSLPKDEREIELSKIKSFKFKDGGLNMNFKIESEEGNEDRTEISIDGVGSVILVETYPRYEFEDDISEEEMSELNLDSEDLIGKIEHIEVQDKYKGQGYAKLLIKKAIEVAKKKGLFPLYLNASPMGSKGLGINDLTNFYEKFGFKVFLRQGGNNLMILNETEILENGGKIVNSKNKNLVVPTFIEKDGLVVTDKSGGDKILTHWWEMDSVSKMNNFLKHFKIPLKATKKLGKGMFGYAFLTSTKTVIKITNSAEEAFSSYILMRDSSKIKTQVRVFNVFKITDGYISFYIIEKQFVPKVLSSLPNQNYWDYAMSDTNFLKDEVRELSSKGLMEKAKKFYLDWKQSTPKTVRQSYILKEYPSKNILPKNEDKVIEDTYKMFKMFSDLDKDEELTNMEFNDIHKDNVGFIDDKFMCFDCATLGDSAFDLGGQLSSGDYQYYFVLKNDKPVFRVRFSKQDEKTVSDMSEMLDRMYDLDYYLKPVSQSDYNNFDSRANKDEVIKFTNAWTHYKRGGEIKNKITFRKNRLPRKDIYEFAKIVKQKYPKVWDKGGNIFGNKAFVNLERVLERGYWLPNEEWMQIKWQSYIARHHKDYRIEGVVAMLKWIATTDKGWSYMKKLIQQEIDKKYPKAVEKYKNGGRLDDNCPVGTKVQSLVFSKDEYSKGDAMEWAKSHGYKYSDVDEKDNTFRLRQENPSKFVKDIFRTIEFKKGLKAIIACPK